ncbi:MAG: CPBP family intramembrane metalloprotease [Planctomycetaceae bacterium]|jgi:membrane protease YdiL (CAAX protease family)|nr:CPBP family intramembrane metalloprotease [Planctomycetaceae bacterium]
MKKIEPAVLVFAMVFPTLLTYIYFVYLAGEAGGLQKAAFGIGKMVQFSLPLFWVAVICKEPFLIRKFSTQGFYAGLFFGLAVFFAMMKIYGQWLSIPGGGLGQDSQAFLIIRERISGFGLNNPLLYLLLGLFYSAIHSGLEEYYWRWFVFKRMKKGMPWLFAAVISSLGFMSHHVIVLGTYFGYDSLLCWLGSAGVAVGGFVWCWIYQQSGSIYGAWISHGIIDAAIFTVGAAVVLYGNAL